MKKRVAALAMALGCLIGFLTVFTELTDIDSFLRRTVLRAAPPQLRETLRPWRAPLVTSSSPERAQSDVLPRSPITLTFLTPMNPSTVERNISFEPQVSGQFSWQDERTCVFAPAQPWPAGARITVEVSRGARSWLLRRMEEPFTLGFTILTSPIVVDTEPSPQVQFAHDLDQVAITFSHLMDEASVERHLSIEPQIRDLELAWAAETLALSGDFRPGTTYQVTITKGAQDAAYVWPMAEDFAWAFTVVERRPELAVAGPGRVGMVEAETLFQLSFPVLNLSRIDLALYTLDGPTFVALQSLSAEDWEQHRPEGNPIREWSASSEAKADRETSQKVAVDPLPSGLYLLAVGSPEGARASQLLSVSRSALILKRAPEQVLVWVVELADGSPAADSEVTIYGRDGQVLATGRTDREGVFKSSLSRETGALLAIAQRDDDVAVCAEEWSAAAKVEAMEGFFRPADTMVSGGRVYAYTDRSIYHPGQEVHFKAIVRRDDDGRYSLLPADTMIPVVVTDEAGRTVYQETLQLTPFGSTSGSFPLSEEATAGRYRLVVSVGGEEHEVHFKVERPPRPGYAVSVTTDQPGYVRGDVITATVSASYDFKVPVAGAEVSYTLYAANYLPLPGEDFDFGDAGQESALDQSPEGPSQLQTANSVRRSDGEKQIVVGGQGVTDDAGRFTVALPTEIGSLTGSQFCTLEARATAPSQQPVSASISFPVHQSSFYVGLRPERRVVQAGQEVAFDVRTVDSEGPVLSKVEGPVLSKVEGRPRGGVRLGYTLDLIEWHREGGEEDWEEKSTEVTRGSLHTDGQGQARIAFKPTTGGTYRLRIEGEDERGNRVANSTQIWVSEAGRSPSTGSGQWVGWRWPEGDQMELITDRLRYRVGEVAEVMVLSPHQRATALLTVERGRVMTYRAVELEDYSDTVSVPVEAEYFPNAFVSVVLIPGHHPDGVELPGFKVGYAGLTVESAEKELIISLSPEKERYQPGERVVCTVRTADAEGQPLSAEVSLTVLDAASSETPGIIEAFYGQRGLAVGTAESLAVHLGREGLAEGVENPVPEGTSQLQPGISNPWSSPGWPTASPLDAPETAYWNPAVVTDEDGRGQVSFRLPDRLTTWRILAQGVTVDSKVGIAAADLVASQDLTVRLASPPFLRMGDQPVLGALLHNHTDKPLETAVTLTVTGLELQDPLSGVLSPALSKVEGSSKGHTVTISAGSTVRVDWPATVSQGSTATVALSAAGEEVADKAAWTVPILPFGDEGGLTDAGGVEDEIALTVSVPKNAITAALTIKGFPSLLALTVDSLDYFQGYPYGNAEQTSGWLLATASVRQALRELDREDEALSQELAQQGQTALWRLYRFQGDDGGWGWWEDSRPLPYVTAQVVHSLIQAQKAGFPVDEVALERSIRALQDDLKGAGDPNLGACLLYVLTEAGEGSPVLADSLLDHRGELAPWAQACLALTMHALGRADEASGLAADLASKAVVTVGTARWQESKLAEEAMASEISTTALALQALLQIDPDSPLIPKALDWLIRVQQDGHWRTPRETAAVVAALTDYLVIKGERTPDHRYEVLVNGQGVGSGVSTGENMAVPIKFVVTELLAGDNEVRLIKEGKERLHYALTLDHYSSRESLEPARALGGPSLRREYFDPVSGEPRTECRVGDLIGVRLTVGAPEDMWYIAVEDPLPAGVEAVEGSLKAESGQGEGVHFEKREEKATLFIQRVEAGEHVYRYLVRAAVPGRFRAMPAMVYPVYEPSLWGRSASEWLQVESLTFAPK
ncbi:MAG: MG2 domain-containing protein [Anaerolineae bacterium]